MLPVASIRRELCGRRNARESQRLELAERLQRSQIGELHPALPERDQPLGAQLREHAVEVRNAEPERVAQNFLRERQIEARWARAADDGKALVLTVWTTQHK